MVEPSGWICAENFESGVNRFDFLLNVLVPIKAIAAFESSIIASVP
jgi:hypothetical protein